MNLFEPPVAYIPSRPTKTLDKRFHKFVSQNHSERSLSIFQPGLDTMLGTCNSYSKQAEKVVAEVRIREGVQIIKKCESILKTKDAELAKTKKKMDKDIKLALARSNSGSQKSALLGVKAANRSRAQIEKIEKVKAYVTETSLQVKEALVKGKANPCEMILPTSIEKIEKQIKKIEKEADESVSSSQTDLSELESHTFLQELLQIEALSCQ